jgi:phage terminase large subunit-like protein
MADIAHLKTVQEAQNYRFDITPVAGKSPKNDRIRRLIPLFEQNRVYLPQTLNYTDYEGVVRDLVGDFIEQEYCAFPVGQHDDMMDSLARIAEPDLDLIWPRESSSKSEDRYRRKAEPSAWAA